MEDDVSQVTSQTIPRYDISLEGKVPIKKEINYNRQLRLVD